MPGLIGLRILVLTASFGLMWQAARERRVLPPLASVLLVAAAFQMQVRALTRPYMFSFLFFSVFFWLLQRSFLARRLLDDDPSSASEAGGGGAFRTTLRFLWGDRGRLLVLPVLVLVWVNMHAGFIVALLLIGAFGAAEMTALAAGPRERSYWRVLLTHERGARFRALLLTGVLSLAASLATPYGPGVLLYPFRLLTEVKMVRRIQEWQPTPWDRDFVVFWAMLVLGALVLARSLWQQGAGSKLKSIGALFYADLLLIGGFGFLAVRTVRHMSWFLLLAIPILGSHLGGRGGGADEEVEPDENSGRSRFYTHVFCVLAAVIVFQQSLAVGKFQLGPDAESLPIGACDFLEDIRLEARFYNIYEWGGYCIYRFYPRRKVFIDGRCLLYGDEIIGQALTVAEGDEGWQDILKRWQVQVLLVEYRKNDPAHFFDPASGPVWRCIYWDDVAIVAVSDRLVGAEGAALPGLPLTNPVVFEENLQSADPAAMLAELDRLVEMRKDSARVWACRARVLVKSAGAGGRTAREDVLAEALGNAKKAVKLNKRRSEPWRALEECYRALGQVEAAEAAARRAESLEAE